MPLIDPRLKPPSPIFDIIADGKKSEKIKTGLYLIGHFSFEQEISEETKKYEEFGELDAYGVCDTPDQLLGLYDFEADPRKICIFFTKLDKATQPADGGWRWHKWGPYVGTQEPKCEYLYDEPEIETVYVYHILVIT